MTRHIEQRLAALTGSCELLKGARRGIEKESLRVTGDALISPRPHPESLGSALTHQHITTDFSEALLEFITPPLQDCWSAIQFLCDLHQFAMPRLDGELLWPMSMPCMIREDADIPIASYGNSNVGRMKRLYRSGLALRYGRYMQAISGIHYNFSLPDSFWPVYQQIEKSREDPADFRSSAYLALVRNVRRLDWLLLYALGSSPAVCASFLAGEERDLERLDSGTFFLPHATSLRMSDLGYHNTQQASLHVSANSLDGYVADLDRAIRTPSRDWEELGVFRDGERQQVNANLLQIENEYYSTIRPKRVARSGERPTAALQRGGVEYVELRALDVSPFDPVGINQRQAKFLEIFLLGCLLMESPPIDDDEHRDNGANHGTVATSGRKPGLELRRAGRRVSLQTWGLELREQLLAVAQAADPGDSQGYIQATRECLAGLDDPEQTPSARFLSDLRETGEPLVDYGMRLAREYAAYFESLAPELNHHRDMLARESRESIERQRQIEAGDELGFDDYLERYFA